MPDVCDLVRDEHDELRQAFARLADLREGGAGAEELARVWAPLGEKLEIHAAAEETVFYPELLRRGRRGEEETTDAISDHNDIRDAVHRAGSQPAGSDGWWQAVDSAREANDDHMSEEEHGALPDMRSNASEEDRERLGEQWVEYRARHRQGDDVDQSDKDPDAYVARNS